MRRTPNRFIKALIPLVMATATGCGMYGRKSTEGMLEPRGAPGPYVEQQPLPSTYFKNHGVGATIETAEQPVSTFSIDVDTASFSMARAYLNNGHLPAVDGVRVEEFVNAMDFGYRPPEEGPFSVEAEMFPSPSRPGYHLLRVGMKGQVVSAEERKPSVLVFVVDVSGSMARDNRLGAVKHALAALLSQLDERDRVGLVAYGSRARVILRPTSATHRREIQAAIDALRPGGATNAAHGLRLAYALMNESMRPGGINRVVLCSDGVANSGLTDADEIFESVERYAAKGVTVTTVGFGMANYNDVLMERFAQIGDGNYAYVDSQREAERLFVENLTSTLQVVARDVKVQVRFNPEVVQRYRLVGYENRRLSERAFEDDRRDAGELGAGEEVTALYEVQLGGRGDIGLLRFRYQAPEEGHRTGGTSQLLEVTLPDTMNRPIEDAAPSARLAFVAAAFAERLRLSHWIGGYDYDQMLTLLEEFEDPQAEDLREMIIRAKHLDRRTRETPPLQVLAR